MNALFWVEFDDKDEPCRQGYGLRASELESHLPNVPNNHRLIGVTVTCEGEVFKFYDKQGLKEKKE